MIRPWRVVFLIFIVLCVYGIYLIRDQAQFEKALNSLFITFDDFPSEYTEALIASEASKTQVQYDYSSFSPHDPASKIPPTIHFIWFRDIYETHAERTKIPSMGSVAPELCRNHNPDFTINVWNATAARDFLERNYAWFLPTYDSYRYPIQRVDAFKYFVLWHEGGVYMDMDISCRRPLTPLLQFPAWFPRASPLGVNNDIMASRAQHPIIAKMSESLKPRNKNLIFPYVTIFWTTGPRFTTDVFKMWLDERPAGKKFVRGSSKLNSDPDEVYVLPQEFYSEQYTFFGHSPGGTWYGPDVAVVLWLLDRPWIFVLIASTFVVMCLVIVRKKRRPKKIVYA